ncbi:MAG: MFS transporter [Chloroflexota bacterium]
MNTVEANEEAADIIQTVADVAPAAPEVVAPQAFLPLWRNHDFMLLWSGQLVSTLGTGIQGVVFPLLILALTNSPEAAGIAGFLSTVPYIIFSLPAGALIDRWDRKRVMIICDAFRALNIATVPIAIYFDVLTVWQLFVVAFIEGSFYVWFNIAEVAAVPRVVPKGQLPAASAQNQAGMSAAQVLAPSIGGLLYGAFGAAIPFLLDGISYIFSVFSLFFVRSKLQLERTSTERHLGREIKEGLSWLWHQPLIRFMAFITGGLNFVNFASGLIVIVLAENMGAKPEEIGVLFSIWAVGGIVGSILGGPIAKRFTFAQVIIGTCWVSAILFPLFAFVPHFYFLGVVAGLLSLSGPIYNVVQWSYRVALIPDHLQGRVNSSFRLIAFGFGPLGSALAGLLLGQFGGMTTVLVFGAVGVVVAVLVTLNPEVRNAKPLDQLKLEA